MNGWVEKSKIKKLPKISLSSQQATEYSPRNFSLSATSNFSLSKSVTASYGVLNPDLEMKFNIDWIGSSNFRTASGNLYFEENISGSSDGPHSSGCYINAPQKNLGDLLNQVNSIRLFNKDSEGELKLDTKRTNDFRLNFLREEQKQFPLNIMCGRSVYSRNVFFDTDGLLFVQYVSPYGQILN